MKNNDVTRKEADEFLLNKRKYHHVDTHYTDNDNAKLHKSSVNFMENISHKEINENNMVHCTSPVGSMDGSIVVESESGEFSDFTTLQVSEFFFRYSNVRIVKDLCDYMNFQNNVFIFLVANWFGGNSVLSLCPFV